MFRKSVRKMRAAACPAPLWGCHETSSDVAASFWVGSPDNIRGGRKERQGGKSETRGENAEIGGKKVCQGAGGGGWNTAMATVNPDAAIKIS